MKNPSLVDIVECIDASKQPSGMTTKIVGIDGCGGAGKTTLAQRLAKALNAQLIHTDDFASWDNPLNWHDRFMREVITPLRQNQASRYQRYDWTTRSLAEWHDIAVQDHIVIEGVSSIRALFRPAYAYTIYVETPQDERLRRGLLRDGPESRDLWEGWQGAENAYLAQETPLKHANLILDGTQTIPD